MKIKKRLLNIFASSYLADLEINGLPHFPFGDGSFKLFLKFNKYIKSNSLKLMNESVLMYDFKMMTIIKNTMFIE